jgi:hypothetical protein
MIRKLFLAVLLLLAGCKSQRYVEGTHLALGAYVPWENGLYGIEIVQYLNGAVLTTSTNTPCTFSRTYSSTNSYFWGMVETRETTSSELTVK